MLTYVFDFDESEIRLTRPFLNAHFGVVQIARCAGYAAQWVVGALPVANMRDTIPSPDDFKNYLHRNQPGDGAGSSTLH